MNLTFSSLRLVPPGLEKIKHFIKKKKLFHTVKEVAKSNMDRSHLTVRGRCIS